LAQEEMTSRTMPVFRALVFTHIRGQLVAWWA